MQIYRDTLSDQGRKERFDYFMKVDRLLGIITTLQQNKKVTAPYLAEKFEVSRRTINRDIEDICRAGIPIVTTQGNNGGISIMEGFSFDTTVFTEQEIEEIFTGLRTLDSVSASSNAAKLAKKIGGESAIELPGYMMIDLSSFYKEDLTAKIEQIKKAIKHSCCILFRYYYSKGEEYKIVEPYLLIFQWSDWYVFGFCKKSRDFRMYKLRRLWELNVTEEKFDPREVPEEKLQFGSHMTDDYLITAVYEPSVKYKLVEEYGPESFSVTADGKLYTKWGYTDKEEALQWLLGFGNKVKVLEPPEMVEKIKTAVKDILQGYEES